MECNECGKEPLEHDLKELMVHRGEITLLPRDAVLEVMDKDFFEFFNSIGQKLGETEEKRDKEEKVEQ